MSWARVHRYLAIVLAVFLVVWSVTGLLFHLKPGWDRAYDMLSAERRGTALPLATLTPTSALQATGGAVVDKVELFDTALGPLYRARTAAGTELFDARTGARISPLGEQAAVTLATDALSRSSVKGDYGTLGARTVDERSITIQLSKGPVIEVGRTDARVSQHGPDTARIDWLYRIHYLQWTGNATIDRAFAVFGLLLIWAVMSPGLVLFVRRRR
jgi:uncharacterized iron-regulated membrane protein